ncbi:MAG TPA: XRE family transcriptional regulator [Candidatus Binatia bacterium]
MAASIPALVNPPLLVWAREEAGYSPDEAAERVRVPVEKLRAWESGDKQPTLRQAERLAAIYHRPMPVFYLQEPPATLPLSAEYRHLPGVKPGAESPELRLALRELHRRREVALELFEENEEEPPRFNLHARLHEDPEDVGRRLRKALAVPLDDQLHWPNEYMAWRTWRDRAEALGLMVFQVPGIPLREMRGVALFLDPLPVLGVNSREHPLARAFTLLHEITHVMLSRSGDEHPAAEERRSASQWSELERFADATTAAALMPRETMLADSRIRDHAASAPWDTEEIQALARRYRVSPVALLTRLVNLRRTTWTFYREWREAWDKQWEQRPKKESAGGPSRVDTILSRVGPTFAALVLDSLERDLISPQAASEALDLKLHHFADLKRELVLGPGGRE